MILSVVTYLLHDDVTGWTDYMYANKHMLQWSRQSGGSSDGSDKRFLQAEEFFRNLTA